jgi:hypothetical protein
MLYVLLYEFYESRIKEAYTFLIGMNKITYVYCTILKDKNAV